MPANMIGGGGGMIVIVHVCVCPHTCTKAPRAGSKTEHEIEPPQSKAN